MLQGRKWIAACAALVIPFTAVLHHAFFHRSTCMLNNFGADYTPAVVRAWILRDPSLPWAMVAAVTTFALGHTARLGRLVRTSVGPFLVAFAPLSLWLWDIPFAGRPICHHFHDNRLHFPGQLGAVRAGHLYALGAIVFLAILLVRDARAKHGRPAPSSDP